MLARMCLVALLPAAAGAQPAVMHFDDFTGPITDQYADLALFSSDPGSHCESAPSGFAFSPPNVLMSALDTGEITGVPNIYIDFVSPVRNLTFWAIDANVAGDTAYINAWTRDVVVHFALESSGGPGNNELIDVSWLPNIIRLEITDIIDDPAENGIGWDEFSFTVVPAPGAGALSAIALLGAARRRR